MTDLNQQHKTQPALTPWHVLATAVVVLGLVVLIWLVLANTESAQDATTVLAVIVPAFASIGAAVFGVQVAYSRGQEIGEKQGNVTGEKRGNRQGKRQLAADLLPKVMAVAPHGPEALRAKGSPPSEPVPAAGYVEVRQALLEVLREADD
jgi:hypothetical protein